MIGPYKKTKDPFYVENKIFQSHFADDIVFTLSMVTSFGALVYFGLKFNERETNTWTKWLISFPMFAASVASRAFTLAVFIKETTLGQQTNSTHQGKKIPKERLNSRSVKSDLIIDLSHQWVQTVTCLTNQFSCSVWMQLKIYWQRNTFYFLRFDHTSA